jgi:hypothetical protein
MPSEGCAIGPDGKLLDASEIDWVNDPDNDELLPVVTTSSTAQPSLDSFITKLPVPARRSTRAVHPSAKAIDPDNAMASKRKSSDAPAPNPSRCLRHVSPEHEEANATDSEASEHDCSTDTGEDDPVDLRGAYEETKALGDADRKVCAHSPAEILCSCFANFLKAMCMCKRSKDDRTADVYTIFTRTVDHIQPGTGKKLSGHYCLVCQYVLIPNLNALCHIITNMFIRKKGVSLNDSFLSGSMSSLRAHIARCGPYRVPFLPASSF